MATTRDYDLGMILNPEVGDEQARAIVDRVTTTVAGNNGQVVRVNAVGRRRLAYPIEHHRDGLYFYFDLILPPEGVGELERTLRVNEDVIRHIMLLRDARAVAQQRQRDAEAEVLAAQARAAGEAAAAASAAAAAAAAAAASAPPPAAELVATEPATAEPAASEPVATEQAATESATAEPVASEPEAEQAEETSTTAAEASA
ncbi:MAG: 30S ribosomal protein S6 [Ktedonobacterales bacterium]